MTMMDSDKAGSTHRGVWDDPEASYAARLGLTHIARVLAYILASVDERIGFVEKRADLARLPLPPSFAMEDPADERYFALYSLVHGDITQASGQASETERGPSGTERGPSGTERGPSAVCECCRAGYENGSTFGVLSDCQERLWAICPACIRWLWTRRSVPSAIAPPKW